MTDRSTGQRDTLDLIVVEDLAVDAELAVDALREAGLAADVRRVDDEPAFRAALDERRPDAILSDWTLPSFSGRRALEIAHQRYPEVPFLFVSGTISEASALDALHWGATDYVYKHQLQQLGPALTRALDEARALYALRESEEKYRRLFESSRDALMVLMPPAWHFTDANPATLQLFGAANKEDFAAFAPWDVSPERQPDGRPSAEKAQEMIATALREGSHFFEWEHRRLNGETFATDILLTRMRADGQVMLQATMRDISERKRYQAQLERHSNYDDLTGLPNRNLLTELLVRLVASCRQEEKEMAVLLFNLDRFKEINDSLGHSMGDKLLREMSVRLGAVSETIHTLAHTGGNEFVLLAEGAGTGEAVSLAQRILKELAQPFPIEERELFLSASIGIAMFPQDGEDGDTLLKNAGAAMYRAKASGGNSFSFYAAEMNAHSLERLNLENELRRAVERDELLLYYQPQMSLHNGEIIGMEALLRWQHPLRGLVSPMEFIPLAEETGLILPIGEWVLRTACTQNRAWQMAGAPAVAMAVNLSARQFEGQDMVALTARVLRETGLDPCYLELELTESVAMGSADTFVGITEALKELGVTLSIDDFGTGYSSLSYLKRFAISRLKIDQSFVRDIVQDPDSTAIAVAVIALAHSLGLTVIAEGVETEAQLNFLRTRGCDEMQGYYFSKPLPAAEFEQLLREGRRLALPADDKIPFLLLVDDESHILSTLKRLLRREGYQILTATSAAEGMELLATHEVAVVMSDQRMPYMTGSEFLAKVREMYPDTIRIILSGYTDLKAITDVVNRGEIYKFLEKPWDDTALLEALREAFRHHAARRMHRIGTA
jgi:diguanylate cyclase (GGDEF)-like protein/PAS domain S-box-containing protein